MLLWPDDHARPHESHERDNLVRRKAVPVDQIRANQASRSTEPGLAVHGNVLLPHGNHLVREVDKLPDELERWAGAVGEDHVEVFHSERGEVLGRVELRVQPDDEADVADLEVDEDVFEGDGQVGLEDLFNRVGGCDE